MTSRFQNKLAEAFELGHVEQLELQAERLIPTL